jgi:hypothetical protein
MTIFFLKSCFRKALRFDFNGKANTTPNALAHVNEDLHIWPDRRIPGPEGIVHWSQWIVVANNSYLAGQAMRPDDLAGDLLLSLRMSLSHL